MIIFLDSILEFFHQVFQWFINLFTKEKELNNNLIADENNNQIKINIEKLHAPKRKKEENEKLDDNKIIKGLTKLTPRSIRYQNRLDRQLEREKKDEELESSPPSSSSSEEEEEEEEKEMDATMISNLSIPLYTSSPISNNISNNSKFIFDKPEDNAQSSTNGTLNQVQLRENQSLNLSPNQDRFFLTSSFLLESSSSSSLSSDEDDDFIYTYKNHSGKVLRSGENYPLELFTYNKNDISDDSNDDDKKTNKRYILIVC